MKKPGRRRYRAMLEAIEERIRSRKEISPEQEAAMRETLEGNGDLGFSGFVDLVLQSLGRSARENVERLGASPQDAVMIAIVEEVCAMVWTVSQDLMDLRDDLRGELEALLDERHGTARKPKGGCRSRRSLPAKGAQPG